MMLTKSLFHYWKKEVWIALLLKSTRENHFEMRHLLVKNLEAIMLSSLTRLVSSFRDI